MSSSDPHPPLLTAGDSEDDRVVIAMAEGAIMDVRQGISLIAMSPDYVRYYLIQQ